MNKKFSIVLVVCILAVSILMMTACSFFTPSNKYKVGYLLGTTGETYAGSYSNLSGVGYASSAELVEAVKSGSVDFAILDNVPASANATRSSELKCINVALTTEQYAVSVPKGSAYDTLLNDINAFFVAYKATNLTALTTKYATSTSTIDGFTVSNTIDTTKEQLVVAMSPDMEPFEYKIGTKYAGIDVEIAIALADYLNQELVIVESTGDFDDNIVFRVGKDNIDIAISCITVTEARKERVRFSSTYYDASQVILVKSTNTLFDGLTEKSTIEEKLASLKK